MAISKNSSKKTHLKISYRFSFLFGLHNSNSKLLSPKFESHFLQLHSLNYHFQSSLNPMTQVYFSIFLGLETHQRPKKKSLKSVILVKFQLSKDPISIYLSLTFRLFGVCFWGKIMIWVGPHQVVIKFVPKKKRACTKI